MRALSSILKCRTPVLGGKRFYCDSCQHEHFSYHSCNNRFCPTCGESETAQWVEKQLDKSLPLPYFMVTFTLPSPFRKFCQYKQKEFIQLFFNASSQALKDILGDPKHLGAQAGFFGIYQSWTQDMKLHPHIHYIVPAGGLNKRGKLVKLKNPDWLVRGEVLGKRLRTIMLQQIEPDHQEWFDSTTFFSLYKKTWNVDVQNFGDGSNALKYLGQYTQRSVIRDSRIESISDQEVCFTTKDRKSGNKKYHTVHPFEFIRNFLQHVLPKGINRIRYYGFLHPAAKNPFQQICELLHVLYERINNKLKQPKEPKPFNCPKCKSSMSCVETLPRAPPHTLNLLFLAQQHLIT